MGYPTKVQLIKRKASEQYYINFPSAVAQAMNFERGEVVEWVIEDKRHLLLTRREAPAEQPKKKRVRASAVPSTSSSGRRSARSAKKGSPGGQEL